MSGASRRIVGTALAGALLALLVALVVVGLTRDPESRNVRADPDNFDQVALGRKIYEEHCASCHGRELEGQADWQIRLPSGRLPAPPHDESGHTWHHSDRQLFEITKHGIEAYAPEGYESDMPAFGDLLTDDEIWAVLAYIKSRWPPAIRQRQSAVMGSVIDRGRLPAT